MDGRVGAFLWTRNVFSQGYPFVEAIASFLPIVNSIYILDSSDDGSLEILKKIERLTNKVHIARLGWSDTDRFGSMLRKHFRAARNLVKDEEYVFYLQANEVLHEKDRDYLRRLPSDYPKVLSFALPYFQYYRYFLLTQEFRVRFFRNDPYFLPIEDAWTAGISPSFAIKEILNTLLRLKIKDFIEDIYFAVSSKYVTFDRRGTSKTLYLPMPIFRYYAISSTNLLLKLESHRKMMRSNMHLDSMIAKLKNTNTTEIDIVKSFFEDTSGTSWPIGPSTQLMKSSDHPLIMQDALKMDKYSIREELFDMIART